MTRAGTGDDPAALRAAALELENIARKAKCAAGALAAYGAKLGPISNGVNYVIGGAASGVDKQMVGTLGAAAKSVKSAEHALEQAAAAASKLAAQALDRARVAAAQSSSGGWD